MKREIRKSAFNLLESMTLMEAAAMDILDTIAVEREALRARISGAQDLPARTFIEIPTTREE